jgi:hypothetical protein
MRDPAAAGPLLPTTLAVPADALRVVEHTPYAWSSTDRWARQAKRRGDSHGAETGSLGFTKPYIRFTKPYILIANGKAEQLIQTTLRE